MVVLGVEGDRDQADVLSTRGKRVDFLGQVGEFPIHVGTKVRERTSGINKRKYNHLAPQIGKFDQLFRPERSSRNRELVLRSQVASGADEGGPWPRRERHPHAGRLA